MILETSQGRAMGKLVVLARFTAVPGRRSEAVEGLRAFVDAAEDESGVEVYAMHESVDEPEVIWFYEVYVDEDAYRAHMESPVRAANRARLDGLRGAPLEVFLLRGIQAKGIAVA